MFDALKELNIYTLRLYYKISGERRRGKDGIKNRARRQRKSYEQIKILRRSFAENEYPNRQEKQALADQLGLTYEQTHVIDYITRIISLLSLDCKIMRNSRILNRNGLKANAKHENYRKMARSGTKMVLASFWQRQTFNSTNWKKLSKQTVTLPPWRWNCWLKK